MQDRLIILLKRNNLTQHWLAELLDLSDKQIGKKINGEVKFNGDEMFKVASHFNMKIEEIFLPTVHQNGEILKEEEHVCKTN